MWGAYRHGCALGHDLKREGKREKENKSRRRVGVTKSWREERRERREWSKHAKGGTTITPGW